MQYVQDNNSLDILFESLENEEYLSIDTETTGFYHHLNDSLFCITISSHKEDYFIDCYYLLTEERGEYHSKIIEVLSKLFAKPIIFYAHNAKFDMHFIYKAFGVYPTNIRDTEVLARLYDNSLLKYSLDVCVEKWVGLAKTDQAKQYCIDNGLYVMESLPGKAKREKRYFYHQVPKPLLMDYACNDTRITYALGVFLDSKLEKNLTYRIEEKLTPVLFRMEQRGIRVDLEEINRLEEINSIRIKQLEEEYFFETGFELIDSEAGLMPVFNFYDIPLTHRTETGLVSFEGDYIKSVDFPFAHKLLEHRELSKLNSTFLSSYKVFNSGGKIKTNFKQSGTVTGRMSSSSPNLQQVSKEGGIRQLFKPSSEDYCLVMIDYDQMEYRVMLDVAEEMGLIDAVLSGLDVHEATAQSMSCTRKEAKTINFLNIYGGGAKTLAEQLKVSVDKAIKLRNTYFKSLPNVKVLSNLIMHEATQKGYVENWAGRKCNFPDSKFSYRAPNHYIQGGCADVVKRAMVRCDEFLKDKKSKMLLSIHDELVFELHYTELDIVNDLKSIMEKAYPHTHLPLTCGVEYSWSNWGDAEGAIKDDEGRIKIKGKDS